MSSFRYFFNIYFILLFTISGLGAFSQNVLFFSTFFLQFFFILSVLFSKKNFFIPKITIFYAMFLIFSFPAIFFYSFNKALAIEGLIYWLNLILIFIFLYNNKPIINTIIDWVIKRLPLFFIFLFVISYFNNHQLAKQLDLTEYNLFFPFYKSNNHLGSYLGLVILYFFIEKNFLFLLIFIPFYLISFNRSGYLASFLSFSLILFFFYKKFFINIKEKNKAINLIIFLLLLTTVIFFTIKSFSSNRLIEPRLIYFYVTLKTIINQPMGIGFYNFGDVSLKYPRIGFFTSETHNIFLEILIGGGVVAFVFFIIFFILIIKNIYENNKKIFLLIIYLTIVFSFSYIYNNFFFFIFFFALLVYGYEEKEAIEVNFLNRKNKFLLLLPSILVFLFFLSFVLNRYFYFQKKYQLAYFFYPLDRQTNINYITELVNNKKIKTAIEII